MKKILSKLFIVFFALTTSFYTFASDKKYIYTPGHPSMTILAETFFPDRINLRRPGADGIILWNNFLSDNNNVVAIQTFGPTHILELLGNNFLKDVKLISVLTNSDVNLFTHKSSGIKNLEDFRGKKMRVAALHNNGICALSLKYITSKTGIEFVLIPYNQPQQSYVDFMGKHVDAICTNGATSHTLLIDENVQLVSNITKEYGIRQSSYLFVKNSVTTEQEREILQTIINNRKNIDKELFTKNDLYPLVFFGKDAQKIFNEDRKIATELVKFIER
jgi:hypothetical protein